MYSPHLDSPLLRAPHASIKTTPTHANCNRAHHRIASSPILPLSASFSPCPNQEFERMSRRQGDWDCRSCQHHNFSWRDSCQQCGNPRPSTGDHSDYAGLGRSSVGFSVPSFRPGDWNCSCGGHNFASRTSCHSCGTSKDDSAVSVSLGLDNDDMPGSGGIGFGGGGWKSGDWLCTRSGCNQHNFASRKECYRCKAPKGRGT